MTSTIKPKGGGERVRVSTDAGCGWTATSNVDWVQIKGASSGTGSREVRYDVDRNRTGLPRLGSITIGTATHIIVQRGGDDDD